MTELVRPVLNGPVTLSVSILFGTMVAMTIQTLYNRQITIHKMLISMIEEVRELWLVLEGFPEPYRKQGRQLLDTFVTASFQDFNEGLVTPTSLRRKEMGALLLLLNQLSDDDKTKTPTYIGGAYSSIHSMKEIRSELISTLETEFSWAHYANILALASILLFVFLLETDQDAMQYLVGFQLSICWAMLVGTYSMLGIVIYDLATPFSGFFSILNGEALDINRVRAYALDEIPASDLTEL
jgi:Protein of unknown function (DUF4239)